MNNTQQGGYKEENVITERVDHLIEHRLPWLGLGLLGGLLATWVVSGYETLLSADVRLAFFIPIVVYVSAAVGAQTYTIYVRALSEKKKIYFAKYIFKESVVGMGLGVVSGLVLGFITFYWLKSYDIGLTVGLTMLINLTFAPAFAVLIPSFLYKRHSDPALGSGPVATIIQDLISLLVFFFVANLIIF